MHTLHTRSMYFFSLQFVYCACVCLKISWTKQTYMYTSQQPLHLKKKKNKKYILNKWCPDLIVLPQVLSHSTFWSSDFSSNSHRLVGLYRGWDTRLPHLLLLSSAVNISKRHNHWLAACFTKECLETCLRAHSGISEGPAVPQCKSPPNIGSSFVVISSDTVRQVHLEISEKPSQKAFQDSKSAILAWLFTAKLCLWVLAYSSLKPDSCPISWSNNLSFKSQCTSIPFPVQFCKPSDTFQGDPSSLMQWGQNNSCVAKRDCNCWNLMSIYKRILSTILIRGRKENINHGHPTHF